VVAEVCHIRAGSTGGPRFTASLSEKERNAFSNLLLLCPTHHKIVDDRPDIYTQELLDSVKLAHEDKFGRPERFEDGAVAKLIGKANSAVTVVNGSGHVAINSPGAIQANVIKLGRGSSRISVSAPRGTLGAEKHLAPYVYYLIKRYNHFASADKISNRNFNYGAIYKNIERTYGTKWQFIDAQKFDQLCIYLQKRIHRTVIFKINATKGQKSYSTYDEFLQK
jgi:hypothetical protein